jgi:hypothetical protein
MNMKNSIRRLATSDQIQALSQLTYFAVGNSRILSPFNPSRFRRASSNRRLISGSCILRSMCSRTASRMTSISEAL